MIFLNGKLKGILKSFFFKKQKITTIVTLIGENKSQGHINGKKKVPSLPESCKKKYMNFTEVKVKHFVNVFPGGI